MIDNFRIRSRLSFGVPKTVHYREPWVLLHCISRTSKCSGLVLEIHCGKTQGSLPSIRESGYPFGSKGIPDELKAGIGMHTYA